MKRNLFSKSSLAMSLILTFGIILTGCGNSSAVEGDTSGAPSSSTTSSAISQAPATVPSANESSAAENMSSSETDTSADTTDLKVRFGDDGEPFAMHIYENDTAAAIARHVGTADWRLPINHFDDYENWEVMQYYDLPSRYEIPSNPETITSAKAGEVYYSDPSRIVLFYGDAKITGEYTKVGYFDNTEEFRAAVTSNPVLEGWGNKIVNISDGE